MTNTLTKDQQAALRVKRARALRLEAWEAYKQDGIDASLPDGIRTIPEILRNLGAGCTPMSPGLQSAKKTIYEKYGQVGLDLFVDGFIAG